MYEKFLKMAEFYMILARKIIKIPESIFLTFIFYDIFPKNNKISNFA